MEAGPRAVSHLAPLPELTAESSLSAAASKFDVHLTQVGKTENTRRGFQSDLRLLGRWLGPDHRLNAITTADLNRFLTWMLQHRGRPCSDKTYARRVTTLKVFFAWLVDIEILTHDPAHVLTHRASSSSLPLVLNDAQVIGLLEAAADRESARSDPRPALLVRLLLDTAMKKGELARLHVSDLAWDEDPPTLLVRYDDGRWKSKERRIEFSPVVRRLLSLYRSRYGPQDRLFECTPRNLEYVLTDLREAADLPDGTCFETLRWTSALRSYRAGVDHERLREKLGLSPITWSETRRRLALLATGAGPARVSEYFPEPGSPSIG
jgi:integrase/recombinase XerD